MAARNAVVVIVLCALLACALNSRRANAQHADRRLDGYSFVSTYYDNNVFSYSDGDRDRFESGDTTGGRYPIEDLADYVTTLALRADYRWDILEQSMWRLRLLYDGSFYARNTERTNHRFGVSLQRLFPHSEVSLAAGYTPDYYLRHLYWRPMPERPAGVRYAAARYDRSTVSLDGRTPLTRRVDGLIALGFARRDYEFPFDERDNNTYSFGAGVDVRIHSRFSTLLMLDADLVRARGAETATLDDDDISNNRFGAAITGTWRVNGWLRFAQTFDYGREMYTTDNVMDITHHDRTDDEFESKSELGTSIVNGWQPQMFFLYRASDSSTLAGAVESGQYSESRFGLQITYYF